MGSWLRTWLRMRKINTDYKQRCANCVMAPLIKAEFVHGLTILFREKILLQIVLAFPDPAITVKYERRSICAVLHSNNNL